MAFPKPSEAAKAAFDAMLPPFEEVKVKPMFGNLGAFLNDQMFMGVFGDHVFLRLDESDREALIAETGTSLFEPMAGRPMKEYVLLPEAWGETPEAGKPWVDRSIRWVSQLPAKKPAAKRSKKA